MTDFHFLAPWETEIGEPREALMQRTGVRWGDVFRIVAWSIIDESEVHDCVREELFWLGLDRG